MSINEEFQSANEELQSTNEELETSKEELQSLNEESVTVNAELQARINELSAANDDIKNLLDVTEIATIFLDIDLNIRRFTPKATEIFPLTATDIGRPISHFASSLQDVDLHRHAAKVLSNLERQEVEVHDKGGTIYRMRVRPYRTVNNVIDGVVVIFMDITELQRLHEATRLAAVVRDSNDAITLLDHDGKIMAWNRGAEKMYGYAATEALRMTLFDLLPRKRRDEAGDLLAELQENAVESLVTDRLRKDGSVVHVWLTASRVLDENGGTVLIATTERDLGTLSQEALRQLTGEISDAGK
jgi:two-component system CheB/CheR fusion protein